METVPHYMGLSNFVDELSHDLAEIELRPRYPSREDLLDDLETTAECFLEKRLSPSGLTFGLWRGLAEHNTDGIDPAFAFGTAFIPHMAISVGGEPTLAIVAELIRPRQDTAFRTASAIGTAIICARKYQAVIAFICRLNKDIPYKHFLDSEVRMALWNNCKVKLVLR